VAYCTDDFNPGWTEDVELRTNIISNDIFRLLFPSFLSLRSLLFSLSPLSSLFSLFSLFSLKTHTPKQRGVVGRHVQTLQSHKRRTGLYGTNRKIVECRKSAIFPEGSFLYFFIIILFIETLFRVKNLQCKHSHRPPLITTAALSILLWN
jgi:hypothetical protein